jgi:hypothetical protein
MEAAFMLMRRAVTALATLGLGLILVTELALAQKQWLVVALHPVSDIFDPSSPALRGSHHLLPDVRSSTTSRT